PAPAAPVRRAHGAARWWRPPWPPGSRVRHRARRSRPAAPVPAPRGAPGLPGWPPPPRLRAWPGRRTLRPFGDRHPGPLPRRALQCERVNQPARAGQAQAHAVARGPAVGERLLDVGDARALVDELQADALAHSIAHRAP